MQQKKDSLSYHLGTAGAATFLLHPIRVGLNRASLNTSFVETIKEVRRYLLTGLGFNLARGALNTGLQSHANLKMQQQITNATAGKFLGLVAATLTGTVVSTEPNYLSCVEMQERMVLACLYSNVTDP